MFWSEPHLCTSALADVPEGGLYCSNTPTKPCSMKRGSLRRSLSLRVATGNQNADQSQASAAAPNNNPQTTTTRQSTAGWRYDRELTARGGIHVNFGADLNRCVAASSNQCITAVVRGLRVGSGRKSWKLSRELFGLESNGASFFLLQSLPLARWRNVPTFLATTAAAAATTAVYSFR